MKTINLILISFLFSVMGSITSMAFAQVKKIEEIKIKTSAECGECKKTLEKAMAYEKGVKSAILEVDSKVLTVIYKPSKTSPEKLKKVISDTGYDADDVPANNKAYKKLKECCKKGAMDHGDHKE